MEKYFDFIERALRTGKVNMSGLVTVMSVHFNINRDEANKILEAWRKEK